MKSALILLISQSAISAIITTPGSSQDRAHQFPQPVSPPGTMLRIARNYPLFLVTLGFLVTGCSEQVEPQPKTTPEAASTDRETWSLVLIDGSKIGHSHLRESDFQEKGQDLLKREHVHELTLLRSGTAAQQRTELTSVETPEGQLVRCQSEMVDGRNRSLASAHIDGKQLIVRMTIAGKQQESALDWQPQWRGFFGVEQSLRNQPLQPGEERQLVILTPVLMQPTTVTLLATAFEPTSLVSATQPLLRIQRTDQVPLATGQTITVKSTLWADRRGEILKTLLPGMGLEEYRTNRQRALAKTGSRPVDINTSFSIRLKRMLPRPHATKHVRYQVRIADGQPADFFSQGPGQQIQPLDDGLAHIDVRAILPGNPLPATDTKTARPTEEDSTANSLVQSDNTLVVTMANSIGSDTRDPWLLACQLEKYVAQVITKKDFTQVFASAAEVAQSRQGDCTEHAVLLAALCRARQIPTRVAIGLIYVPRPNAPEMAYHMWNEVWIQDAWYPLDATLGRGGIGAGHLKLTDSSLAGASAFSALLPVTQVVRQLEVKIISVE
ncbi:MAG: transglutaminase domain-containing protein [Planctomycetaceae bacterium]|nr:transglutaminase domain-containing protein [Planctomycetaceae bacterium]